MERKPLIAGNWKMNLDLDEAVSLVNAIADSISDLPEVDVLVAPPIYGPNRSKTGHWELQDFIGWPEHALGNEWCIYW